MRNVPLTIPEYPDSLITQHRQLWQSLLAGCLLVSLPVFVESPLVRWCPSLCLLLSVGWLGLSHHLRLSGQLSQRWWGSVCWGFSLSWLCGAVYWGWLRSHPAWHLLIESLAVPWAVWGWQKSTHRVGAHFYLGSLLGTACTDAYFYVNGLVDIWAKLMQSSDLVSANALLVQAIAQVNSTYGQTTLLIALGVITALTIKHLRQFDSANWIVAGTLIGTIAVDLLFYGMSVSSS